MNSVSHLKTIHSRGLPVVSLHYDFKVQQFAHGLAKNPLLLFATRLVYYTERIKSAVGINKIHIVCKYLYVHACAADVMEHSSFQYI